MGQQMKDPEISLASSYMQLAYLNADTPGFLSNPMICPHCETECQTAGKVRNSWYALCKCGTYIQTCECADDYYD